MSSRSFVGIANRIPAQVLIVTSALIQYSGAAVAVFAFSVVEPASVAWWRGFVGALVLCAWVRPWRGLDRATLKGAFYFGIALVCMNSCFYEAISRIPLGATVSLEFLGPVAVAVFRGRGWAPRVAAFFALCGVCAIGGLGLDLSDPQTLPGLA